MDSMKNSCYGCLGREDWEDGPKWIGCNDCPRWYHKACLSKEVMEMTSRELKKFNFVCKPCETMKSRKNKKKLNNWYILILLF